MEFEELDSDDDDFQEPSLSQVEQEESDDSCDNKNKPKKYTRAHCFSFLIGLDSRMFSDKR